MGKKPGETVTLLGFLTAMSHRQYGIFGGYLILNTTGRPLEFHCTAPVKPNRAQEILYGSSLENYLFGELIGQTLIQKAKQKPSMIFTDRSLMLDLRESVGIPLLRVVKNGSSSQDNPDDNSPQDETKQNLFRIHSNQVEAHADFPDDCMIALEKMKSVPSNFDLSEPFERIREAIKEAQQPAARQPSAPPANDPDQRAA